MKLGDFKVGWRQLGDDLGYSAVVVLGLATSIAVAYLVGALLSEKVLPDPKIPEPQRLVRLELKGNIPGRNDAWSDSAPFVFRDALVQAKAPIVAAARTMNGTWSLRSNDKVVKVDGMFADPEVARMFGLRYASSGLEQSLARPESIALTETAAERLFGRHDVVGQQLSLNGQHLTVAAVLPAQAGNSILQFEAIVNFDAPANKMPQAEKDLWFAMSGRVFVRLAPGASAAQIGTLSQSLFDSSPVQREIPPEWTANGRKAAFLRAVPVDQLALEGAGSEQNRLLLGGLVAAAAAMLILASINYVNLATVRTLRRQKEIGIRKSLGITPTRLAGQFISEALIVAGFSAIAGLILARLIAPSFSDLLEQRFDDRLFSAQHVLFATGGCLLLGLITGLYPARIALGVRCAESLSGREHSENPSGRWLRRALTTLQFASAMALSVVAVVAVWQSEHARRIDPGFRTQGLLAIDLPQGAKREAAIGLRDALSREAGVLKTGWSSDVPGRDPIGQLVTFKWRGPNLGIRVTAVDAAFFEVYGIHILAGEVVAASEAVGGKPVVLDHGSVQALGFLHPQDAIGQTLRVNDRTDVRIVAVTGPVRQESARGAAVPQAFRLINTAAEVLTVRSDDIAAARRAVERIWPRYFPDDAITMEPVEHYIARHYKDDRQIGILITMASLIALLIASFGVYALAAYTVRRRAREIVIRKVYGADHLAIIRLLAREFGVLFAVGAAIGLPLGWLLGDLYLSGFVLRAEMGALPLVFALLVAFLMTILATTRHTITALVARPVQTLQR
jgi:putative ABC transport system permease protein